MDMTITALVAGAIGGIIGGFSKFFWEKWLPDWMTWKRDLENEQKKMLARYGGPAARAIHELQQRIYVIVFKRAQTFQELMEKGESDYEVQSLSFLVAQCCARLELLRAKMETVNYATLVGTLDSITSSLAGYQYHFPFYRLQQQEVAEVMLLESTNGDPRIIGYARFLRGLETTEVDCWPRLQTWSRSMLEHWPDQLVRLITLQHALIDALDFLDKDSRWIIESKRQKLAPNEVIEKLEKEHIISPESAAQLRQVFEVTAGPAK